MIKTDFKSAKALNKIINQAENINSNFKSVTSFFGDESSAMYDEKNKTGYALNFATHPKASLLQDAAIYGGVCDYPIYSLEKVSEKEFKKFVRKGFGIASAISASSFSIGAIAVPIISAIISKYCGMKGNDILYSAGGIIAGYMILMGDYLFNNGTRKRATRDEVGFKVGNDAINTFKKYHSDLLPEN